MGKRPSPELHDALKRFLPARGTNAGEKLELEVCLANPEEPFGEGGLTLRLVVSDVVDDGSFRIRDVKEQEVFFPDVEDARAAAFLEGWSRAVVKVLVGAKNVDWLMPHDLFPVDAFRLKRAQTAGDFEQALLSKSRLGKLLG